jgi:hypothetical protein
MALRRLVSFLRSAMQMPASNVLWPKRRISFAPVLSCWRLDTAAPSRSSRSCLSSLSLTTGDGGADGYCMLGHRRGSGHGIPEDVVDGRKHLFLWSSVNQMPAFLGKKTSIISRRASPQKISSSTMKSLRICMVLP